MDLKLLKCLTHISSTILFVLMSPLVFAQTTVVTKSISTLFPSTSNPIFSSIDVSVSTPRTLADNYFIKLSNCINSTNKAMGCVPSTSAFFYQFSTDPKDTFGWVNNCTIVKNNQRTYKSPITINSAANTISCSPGPNEIIESHVAVCYQKASGAYCSLATACFEGANMPGQCTKDFPAQELFLVQPGGLIAANPNSTPPCGITSSDTTDPDFNFTTCSCGAKAGVPFIPEVSGTDFPTSMPVSVSAPFITSIQFEMHKNNRWNSAGKRLLSEILNLVIPSANAVCAPVTGGPGCTPGVRPNLECCCADWSFLQYNSMSDCRCTAGDTAYCTPPSTPIPPGPGLPPPVPVINSTAGQIYCVPDCASISPNLFLNVASGTCACKGGGSWNNITLACMPNPFLCTCLAGSNLNGAVYTAPSTMPNAGQCTSFSVSGTGPGVVANNCPTDLSGIACETFHAGLVHNWSCIPAP